MTKGVSFARLLCHFRENGNPDPTGSPVKLGMTKGVSFARLLCHSRENGNPDPTGSPVKLGMTKRNVDPQSEALGFRLRMTRGRDKADKQGREWYRKSV